MNRLSIIIPVYNERRTIEEILRRIDVIPWPIPHEIIIVDDGSTDGTKEILVSDRAPTHRVIVHDRNRGKGAAIRTGLTTASGNVFAIQDADLEYSPADILRLLDVLQDGGHDVVYGSRALGPNTKQYSSYLFHLGGRLVTWWTNILYGATLTDEATCYKMFTRRALDAITLRCERFEFCPELTGKLLRAGFTIHEIPISYAPRDRAAGKKINVRDGITALWVLTKVRFLNHR